MAGEFEALAEKIKTASPGAKLAIGIGVVGILVTIYFATAHTRAASNSAAGVGGASGGGGMGGSGSIPVDGTSGASGGDQFGLFPAGPPTGGTGGVTSGSGSPIISGPPRLAPGPSGGAHIGSPIIGGPPRLAPGPGGVNIGDRTHIGVTLSSPPPSAGHQAVAWAPHHPHRARTARPRKERGTARHEASGGEERRTTSGHDMTGNFWNVPHRPHQPF